MASNPAAAKRAHAKAVERESRSRRNFLPFKLADVYLFRQISGATLRSLMLFAGLLLIAGSLAIVRKAAIGAIPFSGMLQIIALQLPRIFLFSLPMSLLYGALHTFSDLSSKGEVTAFNAGGMSLPRMLRAPLVWGVVLTFAAFFVQEAFVPKAETKRTEVLAQQVSSALGVQENFSWRDPAHGLVKKIVQAEKFDPESKTLTKPSLQFYDGLDLNLTISAESGTWNEQTGFWSFRKGKIVNYPKGRGSGDDTFSVPSYFDTLERDDIPDPTLLGQSNKSRAEHLANGDFEMVSISDLLEYRAQLTEEYEKAAGTKLQYDYGLLMSGATYGIHDKIATPLICLALILVGVPLGLRPQRSSGGVSLGLSLMVILVYYMVWTWASYPGKAGTANPLLMAYLALTLTTLAGSIFIWKKSR